MSYSCRTKIVQAVLDRQRSGVMATIWWFCHDHDRSGWSAMIGNIGKEWSAQCDLGLMMKGSSNWRHMKTRHPIPINIGIVCTSFMCMIATKHYPLVFIIIIISHDLMLGHEYYYSVLEEWNFNWEWYSMLAYIVASCGAACQWALQLNNVCFQAAQKLWSSTWGQYMWVFECGKHSYIEIKYRHTRYVERKWQFDIFFWKYCGDLLHMH